MMYNKFSFIKNSGIKNIKLTNKRVYYNFLMNFMESEDDNAYIDLF